MRTALLSARSAPGTFECHACCIAYTFAAPISSEISFPVFPSVMSLISLLSTGILLYKMSVAYKESLEKGYSFASRPILAIRAGREQQRDTLWLLPWYFTYIICNALYMLLGLIAGILTPPASVSRWMSIVLVCLCYCFWFV
jgi:hypothetical protein